MNVIEKFYTAFSNLDAEAMAECYAENVSFEDPAFGELNGIHASNMWRMLLESQKGKEFVVKFSNVDMANENGTASWEAFYNFSVTGRKVHNKISATFEIQDGLIVSHKDDFNLRKWAKQALGFKGAVLGGTRFFKKNLKGQTARMLRKWESKNDLTSES